MSPWIVSVVPHALLATVVEESRMSEMTLGALRQQYALSRTRIRLLRESACVGISTGRLWIGLAAYRPHAGDTRVVHDFMLRPGIGCARSIAAADLLLTTLESLASRDAIRRLVVVVTRTDEDWESPFERRGYTPLVCDATGVWLQRVLDGTAPSGAPHASRG